MKYANLRWQNTEIAGGKTRTVNVGDIFQFLTIEYIYQKMDIAKDEIIRLSVDELSTYQGEYVILPLNWNIFDKGFMLDGKIMISPRVIPVFLAVTICSMHYKEEYFNDYNISYLKKYEPIGCRDEYTMQILRQHGIEAYLNGCLTAVLPQRSKDINADKIFVVDAPAEIRDYMPKHLFEECEILTQQYYYASDVSTEVIIDEVKKQYMRYAAEAKLVITSRLHAASPCMAMGIPVVFVKEKVDNRFGWLDKLLPLYDAKSYDKINWHPDVVVYEETKHKVLDNSIKRIQKAFKKYESCFEISEFFEAKEKRDYVSFLETIYSNFDKAKKFLEAKFTVADSFYYSIWGINAAAENFYRYMCEAYPQARFKNAIDTYKKDEFHGVSIIKPEELKIEENEVVIVVAVKASNAAESFFLEKGISKEWYVCSGDLFLKK